MTHCLVFGVVLLTLLNPRAVFCHAAQVKTTISNSTADYFVISTSNKDNTITCPASKGCYIHCTGYEHCWGMNIASSKSGPPTWLYLECSGESKWVCQELSISVSPTQSAEIICSTPYACYDAKFTLSTTRAVNIRCTNLWSCQSLHVDASKSNELLLSCGGYGACADANIYPPHHQQYAFSMTCSDDAYSCRGAKVHVPSSSQSVDNYMQLTCPTNNKKEHTCSLEFHCYPTKHVTMMEWNGAALRYECADTVCCPWSNPNNMRRSEKHNMNKSTVAIAVCFVLLAAYYTFGLRHGRAHGATDNLMRPPPAAAPLPIGNDDNAAAVIGHDEDEDVDEKEHKNEDEILAAHVQPGMQMNDRENVLRRASVLNVAQHDHETNGNLIRPAPEATPLPIIGKDGNDGNMAAVVGSGHDEDGDGDEKEHKNEDDILAAHAQQGMQMNDRENGVLQRASVLNVAHYTQWNSDEVVDWIIALNYRAYQRYEHALRHEFRQHEIDGHTLCVLKESDFERADAVTKLLHRRKIHEQIQRLVRGDFVPHDRHDEPQIEGEFAGENDVHNNHPLVAKVSHFQ